MSKIVLLGVGLLLIAVAFLIASETTNQDSSPEIARRFATALHTTPTPTDVPTRVPTDTPFPTPLPWTTPIPGWSVFITMGLELSLPQAYDGRLLRVPPEVQREENGSLLDESMVVYGTGDTGPWDLTSHSSPKRTVRIARLKISADAELLPYTLVGLGFYDYRLDRPRRAPVGRYAGYRSVASGPAMDGSRLTKLIYWIDYRATYWVIVYSTPSEEFNTRLPTFEQSINTLTILP